MNLTSSRLHTFTESRILFAPCLSVKSPLFILFLDCVWQMMNQYPAAFEFTEIYLTVLSDSMWIPLFSTFLFNSPKQRTQHLTVRDQNTSPVLFMLHMDMKLFLESLSLNRYLSPLNSKNIFQISFGLYTFYQFIILFAYLFCSISQR